MVKMLQLYNSLTREKEEFVPREGKTVKMFTCGPSIYRRPHLGNYRSFLWEDVLLRYLRHMGYRVERVLNFTDVEDKAIKEADREGKSIEALTGSVSEQFYRDAEVLRLDLPSFIPRSSTCVDQAVRLIRVLLAKGIAYRHKEDIYFDPLKFPGFGRLFGLDMTRWPKQKRRFRLDTYPGRRWNLGDFILWHGYRDGDRIFWETELGRGRPAWNIQDPAIITEHLGYAIDICCGGIDNLYRHHDYNLAVIEAVSGHEFSRFWIHGEHLLVEGRKMSKSLGNIVYPDDLLADGCSGRHIRFYLLYGHHRKKINLTDKRFRQACEELDVFDAAVRKITRIPKKDRPGNADPSGAAAGLIDSLRRGFEDRMNDDLDIKGAFDFLSGVVSRLESMESRGELTAEHRKRTKESLQAIDRVLQVVFP